MTQLPGSVKNLISQSSVSLTGHDPLAKMSVMPIYGTNHLKSEEPGSIVI